MAKIRIEEGDLTAAPVDAIVNAANTQLKLEAGVAGAIRQKGGPSIQQECDAIAPIRLGDAALTGAGDLAARVVIHAATVEQGAQATEEVVRSAVRRALELARERGLRSIAFPALGAGAAGLALQRCAELMLEEVRGHVAQDTSIDEVRFVLSGEPAYRVFEEVRDAESVRAQLERIRR